MMARSAHGLRGATAEAIQEIVALRLPTIFLDHFRMTRPNLYS